MPKGFEYYFHIRTFDYSPSELVVMHCTCSVSWCFLWSLQYSKLVIRAVTVIHVDHAMSFHAGCCCFALIQCTPCLLCNLVCFYFHSYSGSL